MTTGGHLRESVKFQRRSGTADGYGNTLGTWADLCGPYPARLRTINGKEEVLVGRLAGVDPYEMIVRSCTAVQSVTTQDRAVNVRTGTTYDITAISNPDERNAYVSMLVKSGDAEQ